MLTRTLLAVILILVVSVSCPAAFTNLNFEQGTVANPGPTAQRLEWALGAPGWSHSAGDDTDPMYYYRPHVGCSQWFMLVDQYTAGLSPLSGSYSLALQSGGLYSYDYVPWVNAFISQTGRVPTYVRSIRLKATGDFGVYLNGNPIPLAYYGSNTYGGDISGYAGAMVTLKIQNNNDGGEEWYLDPPVVVDDIQFIPVPEPSGCLTLAMSLIGSAFLIRRRRV
jgi:hypothetical protein